MYVRFSNDFFSISRLLRDPKNKVLAYVRKVFDGFCTFVDDLNASLHIPKTLTGLGITDIDIDRVVAGALNDPSTGGNPVEMTPENTRELLLACC